MNPVLYFFSWLLQTLLRAFPFPVNPGLITVGTPGPLSPVFLTCNFLLSVQRLKRALEGTNAYILVANTHGINVWCGAAGGHFTHHSVISALKTMGIEEHVQHRNVILPQLAATGVEAKLIKEKTDWTIIWGPVRVKDIRNFMQSNHIKTRDMRTVSFPLFHRIEMALFWAFPLSIFLSIPLFIFFPHLLLFTNILVWGLCLLLLIAFPLYKGLPEKARYSRKNRRSSLWLLLLQVLIFFIISSGFIGYSLARGASMASLLQDEKCIQVLILILIIVILISVDLKGLTPLFYSGFLDKKYEIKHYEERCKGEETCKGKRTCITVCPKDCFQQINKKPGITISSPESCMTCGACIVQCRYNALCFISADGIEIPSEKIRKYKLTLLGKKKETQ